MIKLVKPLVNTDGVLESVCDPSMGTGGSSGSSEVVPEVEESKEHTVIDSASPTNEIIHPEESTESSVKKVVKRKKPVVA